MAEITVQRVSGTGMTRVCLHDLGLDPKLIEVCGRLVCFIVLFLFTLQMGRVLLRAIFKTYISYVLMHTLEKPLVFTCQKFQGYWLSHRPRKLLYFTCKQSFKRQDQKNIVYLTLLLFAPQKKDSSFHTRCSQSPSGTDLAIYET